MHLRRLPILAAIALLALTLVGVSFAAFSNASATTSNPPPPLNHPKLIYQDGMPAIPPRTNGTLLSIADVQHYVLTQPFPGGPTVSHQQPKIVKLLLTTSRQASNLLGGEYVTSSENLKVYFVVLNGPFLMENISLPQGINEMPTANHVFEVFDAQTGNLIVWGIYG
jgi:hypothetical protein